MVSHYGANIVGYDVPLDNNEYRRCRFERCRFVYSATGPVTFEANAVIDCDWVFDGPALETLNFLATLYRDHGPLGDDFLNQLFDHIRRGSLPRVEPGLP